MVKLYIIGNGFDLKHKIPSRYSDFALYIANHDITLYEQIERCLKNLNTNGLWSNFEAALGTQDYDELQKDIIRNHDIKRDYPIGIDDNSLKMGFRDWVIALKRYISNDDQCFIPRMYALGKNDYYLSFNYTDTLEKVYNIDNSHICHIHGYIDSKDKDTEDSFVGYIYGHRNDEYKNEIEKLQIDDSYKYDLIGTIKGYQKDIQGDDLRDFLAKVMRDGVSDIVVMGHSLNKIDSPYFKIIKEILINATWHIGYYDEADYVNKIKSCGDLEIDLENKHSLFKF